MTENRYYEISKSWDTDYRKKAVVDDVLTTLSSLELESLELGNLEKYFAVHEIWVSIVYKTFGRNNVPF